MTADTDNTLLQEFRKRHQEYSQHAGRFSLASNLLLTACMLEEGTNPRVEVNSNSVRIYLESGTIYVGDTTFARRVQAVIEAVFREEVARLTAEQE